MRCSCESVVVKTTMRTERTHEVHVCDEFVVVGDSLPNCNPDGENIVGARV
jgi:hypothetical protein